MAEKLSKIFHYCDMQTGSKYKSAYVIYSKSGIGHRVTRVICNKVDNKAWPQNTYIRDLSDIKYLDDCKKCKHGLRMILGFCKLWQAHEPI